MSKLAIIGTAGRYFDGTLLARDPHHYLTTMYKATKKVIELTAADTLISGGAAWADHTAVTFFLRDQVDGVLESLKLELELPAMFMFLEDGSPHFKEGSPANAKFDAGLISNRYHKEFTQTAQKCFPEGWSSLKELNEAIHHPYCKTNIGMGFKQRNATIAWNADHVLAMTFGNGKELKDGGTAHTMVNFLKKKTGSSYHLDLNTGKLYKDAIAHEVVPGIKLDNHLKNKFSLDSDNQLVMKPF